ALVLIERFRAVIRERRGLQGDGRPDHRYHLKDGQARHGHLGADCRSSRTISVSSRKTSLRDEELTPVTKIFIAAIVLTLPGGVCAHAADVSAEAAASVEKAIAEMGCSMDVDDDVEANGDGYKADDVQCKDGHYFMTFDKSYKLTSKKKD